MGFHLHEVPRMGKFMETECRAEVTKADGKSLSLMDTELGGVDEKVLGGIETGDGYTTL